MVMQNVDIYDPDDPNAKEWYDKFFAYQQIASKLPEFSARVYGWRYEPDTWVWAIVTLVTVCGVAPQQLWWVAVAIGVLLAYFWQWAYFRPPRVERLYKKLLRRRSILRVPKFLYDAVNSEASARFGLTDWDKWPARRFALLGELLLEESPMLHELLNDCGCENSCGHTNRLPTRTRREMRRLLREKAVAKLDVIAADHRGALEANQLRVEGVKDMLEQEHSPELPTAQPRPTEDE